MSKDRLGAFMDAVIAIVMTILVLEMRKPDAPTLEAFWDLRFAFLTYAVTFIWLAAMWISLHNAWHMADRISDRTLWLSVGLLFFASLFPYAASLVEDYFMGRVVQAFYGLVVIATTVMLMLIYQSLARDDPRESTVNYMNAVCRLLRVDVGIKAAGVLLGYFVWAPFVSVGVIAAAVFIALNRRDPVSISDRNEMI